MGQDFPDQDNREDIEKYIESQILDYYGEDLINSLRTSQIPTPPSKTGTRFSRIYTALSIVCAVVFLTGIVVFTGVFFSSDLSNFGSTSSGENGAVVSDSPGQSSKSENTDASLQEDITSSSIAESDGIGSQNSDSHYDYLPSESGSSSSENNSKNNSKNENGSGISSHQDSSVIGDSSDSFTNSGSINGSDGITSSATSDTPSRPAYYSLPEIPDEGTVTSAHTDEDNNSISNPHDSVTTGKQFRASLGLILMSMSLAIAVVLNKQKAKKEIL